MASTYWSFRITLADRPGGLAEVARAVADLGVNVLDLDVHLLDVAPAGLGAETAVADDLVVELPYWVEPGLIELCLLRAGARDVTGRRIDPHDLVDDRTRLLETAGVLVRSGADDDALRAAVRAVVVCDDVWVGPARGLGAHGVARDALAGVSPVVGREWVKRVPADGGRAPWVAAIPWGHHHERVVVLVRARLRFTATEVARVQALLVLATTVRDTSITSAA
jgi:hypothetical protein